MAVWWQFSGEGEYSLPPAHGTTDNRESDLNPTIEKRIERLRENMAPKPFDTFMVLNAHNRRYLSGFTAEDTQLDESAGALFINASQLMLATDSRYDLQAADEAAGYEIFCYKEGLAKALPEICRRFAVKSLGFESARLTVHQHQEIQEKLASQKTTVALIATDSVVEAIRLIKDPDEIDRTRQAIETAEHAFLELMAVLKPGMSEREAAWLLEKGMREAGADALSFPVIAASGPNSALPHAIPGLRGIGKGEPFLLDWGAIRHGYCSDTSRTVILGPADDTFRHVFQTVVEAQALAIEAIREGVSSKKVDGIARSHIESRGYKDRFGHSLGHGTGLAVHEGPALSPLKDIVLKEGMLVTVEPGIYLPGWGGVRVENQVVVRKNGAEVLTRLDVGPLF